MRHEAKQPGCPYHAHPIRKIQVPLVEELSISGIAAGPDRGVRGEGMGDVGTAAPQAGVEERGEGFREGAAMTQEAAPAAQALEPATAGASSRVSVAEPRPVSMYPRIERTSSTSFVAKYQSIVFRSPWAKFVRGSHSRSSLARELSATRL